MKNLKRVGLILLIIPLIGLAQSSRRPEPISIKPPQYPFELSRDRIGGRVEVEYVINEGGETTDIKIARSTHEAFNQTAMHAVAQWKYHPGIKEGRPINVRALQMLEFQIQATAVYPFDLLRRGIGGKATAEYSIDRNGQAVNPRIVNATREEVGLTLLAQIMRSGYAPEFAHKGAAKKYRANLELSPKKPVGEATPASTLRMLQLLKAKTEIADKNLETILRQKIRVFYPLPRSLSVEGQGKPWANIEFFVDDAGKAVLPKVVEASFQEIGFIAAQIVSEWVFEPQKDPEAKLVRSRAMVRFSNIPEDLAN